MYTLTAKKRQDLLEIINEEFGAEIDFEKFSVTMLCFFEYVPGFETIPRSIANRFVYQLWRKYHGQSCRKETYEACRQTH